MIHGDYLAGSNYMQVLHPNHSLQLTTHVSSDECVHLSIPQFMSITSIVKVLEFFHFRLNIEKPTKSQSKFHFKIQTECP